MDPLKYLTCLCDKQEYMLTKIMSVFTRGKSRLLLVTYKYKAIMFISDQLRNRTRQTQLTLLLNLTVKTRGLSHHSQKATNTWQILSHHRNTEREALVALLYK